MNKERRAKIDTAIAKVAELVQLIDEIRDEERKAFDDLSEKQQESDKGQQMEGALSSLEEAVDLLANVDSSLEDAKSE